MAKQKKELDALQQQKASMLRTRKIKLNLWCWGFMLLAVVFWALFQGWPIINSFYYSLLNWSGMTTSASFIGLNNYRELMADSLFWNAFWNSFKYTVILVPIELAVSLFIAYLLNNDKLRGRSFYRCLYFIPVITTTSIVGIIMVFIWSVQGPVNGVLTSTGIAADAINFLGTSKWAMPTLILVSVWKDCGIYMIYWLSGLQSVPKDVYEAAVVDGASRPRTFFSIVLPIIAPTAGVITILCTINSLKVFDIVKTLTNGGPYYSTDVIATYVYRTAFSSELGMPRFGYASAMAFAFGVVVITIGLVLNIIKGRLQKNQ